MRLQHRLAHLERLLPPPPSERPEVLRREALWEFVLVRWERLVRRAMSLMTNAEREGVVQAAEQLLADFSGPYAFWLADLCDGRCRLPLLPPAAMKDLLLAWLSPEADGGRVCVRCGLEFPQHKTPPQGEWKVLPGKRPLDGPPPWYDLPELFSCCPSCGAPSREADWPSVTGQAHRAWKKLDGFVG
jgi:hypothetical protein